MEMWKVRIDVKQPIIEKELPKDAVIKNVISHKGYIQICFECEPEKEKEVRKLESLKHIWVGNPCSVHIWVLLHGKKAYTIYTNA